MSKKQSPVVSALICLTFCISNALAQSQSDVDRINKWFDDRKDKKYEMQRPGEIQQAGPIQTPGYIQAPRGWQAITVVKKNCQERMVVNSDTLFEFDKATLTPFAEQTLKLLGPKLKEQANHPICIEGHTDGKGSDEYNQSLSERRAERVKNWLMSNHFVEPSTTVQGFGKKHPVAPNTNPDGSDNPKGRQSNRRVEIVINTCQTLSDSTREAGAQNGKESDSSQAEVPTVLKDAAPAKAATNDDPLPYSELYTPQEIRDSFSRARIIPLGDPHLYFEVLIPNNWESRPITVTKKQLSTDTQTQVPLAELAPPDNPKIVTEVRYMRVPEGVTAEQFLLLYAAKSGFDIIKRQHAEFNGRKAEDALLKLNNKEFGPILTRITVSRRDNYMFLIASSTPAAEYDNWKRVLGAAAVSFDPSGKDK